MSPRYVLLVLAAAAAASTVGLAGATAAPTAAACPPQRLSDSYVNGVMRALRAKRDVWGEELLRAPRGPTYAAAKRRLKPLLLARARGKTALTDSGVYYLPFGMPRGDRGAGTVALHVADGSQVIRDRVGGAELDVSVGGERFGACRAHLRPARLADGWLPILQTRYRGYEQESFSARVGRTLETFVHVTPAASFDGVSAEYVRWRGGRPRPTDAATYAEARAAVVSYWTSRLAEGASIEVPEQVVNDAMRATLVQNLLLTWRYSIGNPYEQFSFPEGVDVAQVMTEFGFADVGAAILRTSLTRKPTPYPQWKMGEKLLGNGWHFRLTRDRAHLARVTPALRGYVRALARSLQPNGLLPRERYSSDIPDQVYGLHAQAVVWHGLRTMADAWAATGRPELARASRRLAGRLGTGLRRAVRASQRRLPDGSLFVPVQLLGEEHPYASLTEARLGSYWNLVMPYALASGVLEPPTERGIWRYMRLHGSRLLGTVRAGAYALYRDPVHPVSGTDQVYGINVARFLARQDEADQLVLSLYGTLATALTEHTFVGGEAASVAPLGGRYHRAMYLPPNGATNAAFLETLRSLLVHERGDGLELAHATPRAWLAPGKRIAVRRLPTRFGPLSYTLEARAGAVDVTVDVPGRARLRTLKLRLRLPGGDRMLDLSGRSGRVELTVGTNRSAH